MNLARRVGGLCLIPVLAVALPVSALDYPLTDTAVRSAFLTGSNGNDRARELFAGYTHEFSAPESGPYIQSISIETPYEQVAEFGAMKATSYHAQEAEQEFSGKELPLRVRVQIGFTDDYPAAPPRHTQNGTSIFQAIPSYERDFEIRATQGERVAPIATRLYVVPSFIVHNINGIGGMVIEQEYDAAKFDASSMTIQVTAPGGQDIETTFNLAELH
jgi:hypothetical protein